MKETDTHTTPHIIGRDSTREGHRQAPKHTSLLTDSSNQRLNTQRKCADKQTVLSLGSEVTRVLFFIGLSVFLKFPKTNIYYINNRGEFLKKNSLLQHLLEIEVQPQILYHTDWTSSVKNPALFLQFCRVL